MQTSLQGIAHKAPSQQAYRFRNLDGIRNEELRKDCWRAIRPEAADADDFGGAFARPSEAARFYTMPGQRRGQLGLELSAEKTRVMPCSRHPPAPKTSFEFLGCECRWAQNRAGQDHVTRRTARPKLRTSRKRFTQGCREHRNLRLGVLCARLNAKRRGDYNYYGVHGNFARLKPFVSQALGLLKKWRNRRRQRRSYNWAGDNELLAPCNIERPRIFGRPQSRLAASKA
jgi:RNA-directed DNA polymerase